jgi:hypothetical protein
MVLVAGGLEAGFVLAQAKRTKRDRETVARSLYAIGLLTLALSIFADFVPEVAGPFALLVLVALAARSRGALGEVLGTSETATVDARPRMRPRDSAGRPRKGD